MGKNWRFFTWVLRFQNRLSYKITTSHMLSFKIFMKPNLSFVQNKRELCGRSYYIAYFYYHSQMCLLAPLTFFLSRDWLKKWHWLKEWPLVKNSQFLPNPHENWVKYSPFEVIIFPKFHKNWAKIVDFLPGHSDFGKTLNH